jgi:hypothetical protein
MEGWHRRVASSRQYFTDVHRKNGALRISQAFAFQRMEMAQSKLVKKALARESMASTPSS